MKNQERFIEEVFFTQMIEDRRDDQDFLSDLRSESYVPDPNARPDYRILIEFNDYLV